MAFKMKSGNKPGFKGMGSSPALNMKDSSYKQSFESPAKKELIGDQENLPERLKASIEASPGKMYDSPGKMYDSPAKQRSTKEGEGQDQDKIFDENGKHVGDYVNGKKVMKSTTSAHGQLEDAERDFKRDMDRARPNKAKDKALNKMLNKKSPAKQVGVTVKGKKSTTVRDGKKTRKEMKKAKKANTNAKTTAGKVKSSKDFYSSAF